MSLEGDLHRVDRASLFLSLLSIFVLFIYSVLQSVFLLLTPRRYRKKKDLAGQNVLITGAGNGLGRQMAIQFSKQSTCLSLLDIDRGALLETSQLLHDGCRVFVYECDITNRRMVYAVAEQIKDDVGHIDILVNNAGTVCGKSLIDLPDDSIMKTMEVNTISHFWTCKAFLPAMMARNSGHIVTVSSIAGHIGVPKLVDYCASKHSAIGFSEALELEMRAKNLDGIKVTIVCPYLMNTRLFEGVKSNFMKTVQPEQVAEEILEGIRMEEETIYVPRTFRYLMMMKSIVPRWLYCAYLENSGDMYAMDNFRVRSNTDDR